MTLFQEENSQGSDGEAYSHSSGGAAATSGSRAGKCELCVWGVGCVFGVVHRIGQLRASGTISRSPCTMHTAWIPVLRIALRVTDVVENTSLFLMGLQAQQRKRVCYILVYIRNSVCVFVLV